MDTLKFLRAKIDLEMIAQRIDNSLNEIKNKNPERLEYINPMTESIKQLANVRAFLDQLELELNTSRQRNIDLETLNLIRLKEIEELKGKLKYNNLDL